MQLTDIEQQYAQHSGVEAIASVLNKKGKNRILATDCCGSMPALVLSALNRKLRRTIVVVLENQEEAAYMQHDIAAIQSDGAATGQTSRSYLFPTTHRIRQKGSDESYTIQRTEVLAHLKPIETDGGQEPIIISTYPEALMEEVASQEALMTHSVLIQRGEQVSEAELSKRLIDLGFERTDFVYEPGQFAIRGGIISISRRLLK